MPSPYFKFKQFTIYQDKSAMKVCTDSCILGAWFAQKVPSYSFILDIGSGTGLLMMMLAQNSKAEVHGIEIDLPSFKQQKENIDHSPWKDKLRSFPGDARSFAFPCKYDFIISNPPFFENDLLSSQPELNIAKHGMALSLEDLLNVVDANLSSDGSFGILLPFHRWKNFELLAIGKGFHIAELLFVKQQKTSDPFRVILHLTRQINNPRLEHELIIYEGNNQYTQDFRDLLKDYYLYLDADITVDEK